MWEKLGGLYVCRSNTHFSLLTFHFTLHTPNFSLLTSHSSLLISPFPHILIENRCFFLVTSCTFCQSVVQYSRYENKNLSEMRMDHDHE